MRQLPPPIDLILAASEVTLHYGETGRVHVLVSGGPPGATLGISLRDMPTLIAPMTVSPLVRTPLGFEGDIQIAVTSPVSNTTLPNVAYRVTVMGYEPLQGLGKTAVLTVNILPTPTLVVDHDYSEFAQGGYPSPLYRTSPSDLLLPAALAARQPWLQDRLLLWDVTNSSLLAGRQLILLYTGQAPGTRDVTSSLSPAEETAVARFLDTGDKIVVLFSSRYASGLNGAPSWDALPSAGNELFVDYVGAVGAAEAVEQDHHGAAVAGTSDVGLNLSFTVAADAPMQDYWSIVNPAPGTDTLFTIDYDPGDGIVRPVAVATGRRHVGAAGTSTIVYVGFAVEDIVGADVQAAVLEAIFDYAGVCRSGLCGATTCRALGASCDASNPCCGGQPCTNGVCPISGTATCVPMGGRCRSSSECCYKICQPQTSYAICTY